MNKGLSILLLLISFSISEAQVTMFRSNETHTGVINTLPLKSRVERKFTFQTQGVIRSTPAIEGEAIYFGSADGNLYSINKNNGEKNWSFKTNGSVASSPAVAKNLVIFSSRDKNIYAVEKLTGKLVWKYGMGEDIKLPWGFDNYVSSPLVINDEIYIGSGDGNLYKLSFDGNLIWKYKTQFRIRTTPASNNGVVYFGDTDGTMYALEANSGKLKWSYDTQGKNLNPDEFGTDRKAIMSSPAIAEGKITFGARDGFLYTLEEETGKFLWHYEYPNISWVIGSPAVENNRVYAGTSDGRFFHCLDLTSGKEIWNLFTGTIVWTSGSIVKDMIYFGDSDGNVYGVKKENGELVFKYKVGDKIFSSPVINNATLYVGSDDGHLYALSGSPEEKKVEIFRGVFYDEKEPRYYFKEEAIIGLKNYFVENGYTLLDTPGLENFMKAAVDSGKKSTVVFVSTIFPENIFDYKADNDLLRNYFKAGNNAVILTRNPLGLDYNKTRDSLYEINFQRAEKILGIKYEGPSYVQAMTGLYNSAATETGKKMGMPEWFVGSFGIDPAQADKVLALDEYGKATAWIKSFTENKYNGFIQLWLLNKGIYDPSFIKNVAEYGFYQ